MSGLRVDVGTIILAPSNLVMSTSFRRFGDWGFGSPSLRKKSLCAEIWLIACGDGMT